MSQGDARRVDVAGVKQLVDVIGQVQSNQAIALGVLKPDLPAVVRVATKKKLVSEVVRPDVIARTGDAIIYRDAHPAFALLDFDTKGMPPHVGTELKRLGGFGGHFCRCYGHLVMWRTWCAARPAPACRVPIRGDELPGSDGLPCLSGVEGAEWC